MTRLPILVLLAATSACAFAQFNPPGLTAASKKYHAYRMAETDPPYGLAKVEAMIKRVKRTDDAGGDGGTQALPANKFNSLTFAERFTYCMVHGEILTQNCDGMPATIGEEHKIFGHPLGPWGEEQTWSEAQQAFLHKNRTKVIGLLRATMRAHNRVGTNLKKAILQLDAYELIPDMVSIYDGNKKDNDILSVFFLLMKDGKYKPFLASATYKKLYGDEDASYKAFVVANPENKKLTIDRAMAYYKSRKG